MDNNISTDEQMMRFRDILKQWSRYEIGIILALCLPIVCIGFYLVKYPIDHRAELVFLIFSLCSPLFISRWARRRYARRLSKEDYLLTEHIAVTSEDTWSIIRAKELLKETHKDHGTLLRATIYTNDTAQEQLLRPAQSHDVS